MNTGIADACKLTRQLSLRWRYGVGRLRVGPND